MIVNKVIIRFVLNFVIFYYELVFGIEKKFKYYSYESKYFFIYLEFFIKKKVNIV